MYSNDRKTGFSVLDLLVKIIFAALFVLLLDTNGVTVPSCFNDVCVALVSDTIILKRFFIKIKMVNKLPYYPADFLSSSGTFRKPCGCLKSSVYWKCRLLRLESLLPRL